MLSLTLQCPDNRSDATIATGALAYTGLMAGKILG